MLIVIIRKVTSIPFWRFTCPDRWPLDQSSWQTPVQYTTTDSRQPTVHGYYFGSYLSIKHGHELRLTMGYRVLNFTCSQSKMFTWKCGSFHFAGRSRIIVPVVSSSSVCHGESREQHGFRMLQLPVNHHPSLSAPRRFSPLESYLPEED